MLYQCDVKCCNRLISTAEHLFAMAKIYLCVSAKFMECYIVVAQNYITQTLYNSRMAKVSLRLNLFRIA